MPARPVHILIQITDLHIGPTDLHIGPVGGTARDPVDTFTVLGRALRAIEDASLRPTALLFTGDLVENGAPDEYRRLRDLLELAAARIGAPAVYVAGNHDDRAVLREHLLGEFPTARPLDHVVRLGDLRIIVLDSTVPGYGYGELEPEQLTWLRSALAEPAPDGTVLALHHPPLPSSAPLATVIELQHREELAEAIDGTDVRVVLAGHTHIVSAGILAGVPVWTGGAIATTLDGLGSDGAVRGLGAPTVSHVDLFADTAVVTSVPIGAETLTTVPASLMERKVAELRAQLPAPRAQCCRDGRGDPVGRGGSVS